MLILYINIKNISTNKKKRAQRLLPKSAIYKKQQIKAATCTEPLR